MEMRRWNICSAQRKNVGIFHLDAWISLKWSGNVGREILLYMAVLLCVCAALCMQEVLPGLVQRGESSPRSFLGRIFLFSTGRAPKEPSLGQEAERTWTEGGPVIEK